MMNVRRLGTVALAFAMMAVIAVPAFAASDEMTYGRFVQEMAKAKRLNATDAVTARDSLRSAGIVVPEISFNKRLTELDVTLISRTAGLQVTTSNPDGYFNEDQVDRFFASFASEFTSPDGAGAGGGSTDEWCQNPNGCDNPGEGDPGFGNGNGPPFDPFTKGKGKNKGKGKQSRTPTDPE